MMFYHDELIFMAVELKYCERCGALYLRRSGSMTNFCLSCVTKERVLGIAPGFHATAGESSVLYRASEPGIDSWLSLQRQAEGGRA